ncbi:MAG: sigma-70 family RNA polymerase sigma factor [Rikenellaceae bacterium]|nr:sigma-70 family RNA polymerase sigma factor [Rikenellaceae bacterium]
MELEQIIDGCRKADNGARRELYERYSRLIFGVLCRYVPNRAEAEDLLHDCFITIFTRVSDYRGEGSFEGWCRRIAVHTALDHLRRSNRLDITEIESNIATINQTAVSPDILDRYSTEEVVAMIGQLTPVTRAVFNLRVVDGLDYHQIAQELGIKESTARSQFRRAREAMIELLRK